MLRHLAPCLALLAGCAIGNGEVADDGTGGGGGGSVGGGGGGGGGGGEAAPDASCPSVHLTTTRTTPSVQLLIDRSLSMNYKLDSSATVSRYSAVGNAVIDVVGQLQGDAYFGASVFTQNSSACPSVNRTAARQLNNLAQIQTLLQTYAPEGNTPTAAAFAATAAEILANPPPADSPPIIVLATDGFPNNCQLSGDPIADTVAAIRSAHADGIRTFVLGIAGVGDYFLQQAANAGQGVKAGQPEAKYFTASSAQDLRDAFQSIIGAVASCELAIDGAVDPQLADSGTVTLDGELLKYDLDWTVVSSTTLRLEGAACEKFKASSTAHVEATFPCTAVILL